MIPSSWVPEFGETADLFNNSRSIVLEPILEETSEEEETHELSWSQHESIWSSQSDTGSVIQVDLTQEPDCTSEREFACPPKRRKQNEFDVFDDNIQIQKPKTQSPARKTKIDLLFDLKLDNNDVGGFNKRPDFRINSLTNEFLCPNDIFSDSDSLSYVSLSRSSSLIQFESLEKQIQNDNISQFGSSPSLYSQVSMDSMDHHPQVKMYPGDRPLKKNNLVIGDTNENKIRKSLNPSQAEHKTNCVHNLNECLSNSDTDSSLSSGASYCESGDNSLKKTHVQIKLNDDPIEKIKRMEFKSKNSIESLSEDSGYSENFPYLLKMKSKSTPCFYQQNSNLSPKNYHRSLRNDDFSDDLLSRSLEDIKRHSLHQHHSIGESKEIDNLLYLDTQISKMMKPKICKNTRSNNTRKIIKKMTTTTTVPAVEVTKVTTTAVATILTDSINTLVSQKSVNKYNKKNTEKTQIPRQFISTSSPILHEEIGLIFNGGYPDSLLKNSHSFRRDGKNLSQQLKDFSVITSVPENLNLCETFESGGNKLNSSEDIYHNTASEDDDENLDNSDSEEIDNFHGGGGFRDFDNTSRNYNLYNFESGKCTFNPSLTMSYANLAILSDSDENEREDFHRSKNSLRNSLERAKSKESNILLEFSTNFNHQLSILTDRDINYDPVQKFVEQTDRPTKTPPQPPPRRSHLTKHEHSALSEQRVAGEKRTFDQDPTNLKTCYAESLERCNFDMGKPFRVNSTEYLTKPLTSFAEFISSTPNLNFYDVADTKEYPTNKGQSKSLRQISNQENNKSTNGGGIMMSTSNSKGNLSKGVSFCPIVSEISWREANPEYAIFDDCLNEFEKFRSENLLHDDEDDENLIGAKTSRETDIETAGFPAKNVPLNNANALINNIRELSSSPKFVKRHIHNNKQEKNVDRNTNKSTHTTNCKPNDDDLYVEPLKGTHTYETKERDHHMLTNIYENNSSLMPNNINTTKTKPTTMTTISNNKKEFTNENISLSMNSVECKPLQSNNSSSSKNNYNLNSDNKKLINLSKKNIKTDIFKDKMEPQLNSESAKNGADGKMNKKSGGFLSRFSSFRFSLKNKSKNKNKSDGKEAKPIRGAGGVILKTNRPLESDFSNIDEINTSKNIILVGNVNQEIKQKPLIAPKPQVNFVRIPSKELTNKHEINTLDSNTLKLSKNNQYDDSTNEDYETSTSSRYVNSTNDNNNHVLISKPPLPKQPPRVIGVSTKRTAHVPPRASSLPREINDEYDKSFYQFNSSGNTTTNVMIDNKLNNSSFNNNNNNKYINNHFIMSEKLHSRCDRNQYPKNESGGSKIGLLETNLDTHETIVTGKTRSLMELIPQNKRNFSLVNDSDTITILNGNNGSTRRPHKSMEFLLDKDNQKEVLPPENELQKSHESNTLSEHQLRVQASLQRLNIPDWFKSYAKDGGVSTGGYTGNFYKKRNSDVASGRWAGLNSKTTSLSSLGSHRSDKSPLMLSPSAHSHHGQTGFSRWSTSHLNSTQTSPSISTRGPFVRGNLNASTMSGQSNVSSGGTSIRSSFRQPYLGWRSQEKLSQPRTPHERLASSILSQQKQMSSQVTKTNNQETEEIQSSIKEVTSAIVHYVNDQTNRTSRSRSASPNTRKCWLESSFVGNRPLESPQTPIIDKSMHEKNGKSVDVTDYNGGATPIPAFSIQPEMPSPGSATLEDVLASLLGLPLESHRSSENIVNDAKVEGQASHLQVEQVSLRRRSEGDAQKRNSTNPTAEHPPRRVSLDSSESKHADTMKCRYPKCDATTNSAEAKKLYKSCHNCSNTYCSRECRRAHWEKHRKACLHSRVSSLCRQALSTCKDDADTLRHLSLIARKGYLSQGRGVVRILFRSPESADIFIKQGFQCVGETSYVRWADLMPAEMGPELYSELLRLSTEYKPDAKMLVYIAICVVSEAPGSGAAPVKWERQLVSRCAKLKLCKSVVNETNHMTPLSNKHGILDMHSTRQSCTNVLILTFSTAKKLNLKNREHISKNIQLVLKEHGINLRKHYPEVFQRLSSYVEGTSERFLPVTLHPRDSVTGKSFTCIIMPNSNGDECNFLPTSDSGNCVYTIDVSLEHIESVTLN